MPPVQAALGILYRQEKFLMQLRDDLPHIAYPGVWALFGGHVEVGEPPELAFQREIQEEIGYQVPEILKFSCYQEPHVIRHIFHSPLTVDLNQLILEEGQDMALVSLEQIQAGECYSSKAGVRSLALPHQKILLEFIQCQKSGKNLNKL
ncbi:MAG: NUDIX domain-containing protein [Oscillatoriales cyanobacterium RM2_1_1]|nr:NUDIX domain-containing protein [Oscillatoriales cyanobacterium SM2_3_0]NJO47069.1 NUDIX domain-containing protein [Oscillatoriales cyanobacterium RM2_1_1]